MKNTNRLDWTISKKQRWIATYKDGTVLIAFSKEQLMSKINEFELSL